MPKPSPSHGPPYIQRGAVLIVSLVILLVMTLLGVTAMQGTTLEEKMAGNLRQRNIAFQSAESALRASEAFIESVVTIGAFDGTNGLFGRNDAPPDPVASATWTSGALSVAAPTIPGSHASRYFVQQVGTLVGVQGALNIGGYGGNRGRGDITTFRLTARGTGTGDDTTSVLLRSYYGRVL